MMKTESYEEYERLSEGGGPVPVYREVPGDLRTPVSAFLALTARSERAFLLESVVGGERQARYSFIGRDPMSTLEARGPRVVLREGGGVRNEEGGLLAALRRHLGPHAAEVPGLPRFTGGAVGWLSWDAVRLFERIPDRHAPSDAPMASILFLPLHRGLRPRAASASCSSLMPSRGARPPGTMPARCSTAWRRICAGTGEPPLLGPRPCPRDPPFQEAPSFGRPCGGPRSTSRPGTSSRWSSPGARPCHAPSIRSPSIAPYVWSIRLPTCTTSRRVTGPSPGLRPKCSCGWRTDAWRRGPSPGPSRAAPWWRRTNGWSGSCWPTPRSEPST